jgi:hypothetical protein
VWVRLQPDSFQQHRLSQLRARDRQIPLEPDRIFDAAVIPRGTAGLTIAEPRIEATRRLIAGAHFELHQEQPRDRRALLHPADQLLAEAGTLIGRSDSEQGHVHGAAAELRQHEAGQLAAICGDYGEMFARAHVRRDAPWGPAPGQAGLDQRARSIGDARGIAQAGQA